MFAQHDYLSRITRPGTLVRAAQFAAANAQKNAFFRKLALSAPTKNVLNALIAEESALNASRQDSDRSYSSSRHVLVLAALILQGQSQVQA